MKRCPQCSRTYTDETLAFCLADGSLLSAPYDSNATLRVSSAQRVNSATNEVLQSESPRVDVTTRGGKPVFLYTSIALAVALVVGGTTIAWLKLSDGNSSKSSNSVPETTLKTVPATSPQPFPTSEPINISGRWRDRFGFISQITQQGDTFQIVAAGIACKGKFTSAGSGTINGTAVKLFYKSTYSAGECQGIVSPDGMQLESTCVDTVCGAFQNTSRRQRE